MSQEQTHHLNEPPRTDMGHTLDIMLGSVDREKAKSVVESLNKGTAVSDRKEMCDALMQQLVNAQFYAADSYLLQLRLQIVAIVSFLERMNWHAIQWQQDKHPLQRPPEPDPSVEQAESPAAV